MTGHPVNNSISSTVAFSCLESGTGTRISGVMGGGRRKNPKKSPTVKKSPNLPLWTWGTVATPSAFSNMELEHSMILSRRNESTEIQNLHQLRPHPLLDVLASRPEIGCIVPEMTGNFTIWGAMLGDGVIFQRGVIGPGISYIYVFQKSCIEHPKLVWRIGIVVSNNIQILGMVMRSYLPLSNNQVEFRESAIAAQMFGGVNTRAFTLSNTLL